MKDVIILKKTRENKMLLDGITNITILAKMAWTLSFINLAWKYNKVVSNTDMNAVKKLGLTRVKKY